MGGADWDRINYWGSLSVWAIKVYKPGLVVSTAEHTGFEHEYRTNLIIEPESIENLSSVLHKDFCKNFRSIFL